MLIFASLPIIGVFTRRFLLAAARAHRRLVRDHQCEPVATSLETQHSDTSDTTHQKIMDELLAMSPHDVLKRSVEAGVHHPDGTLTTRFASDALPKKPPFSGT